MSVTEIFAKILLGKFIFSIPKIIDIIDRQPFPILHHPISTPHFAIEKSNRPLNQHFKDSRSNAALHKFSFITNDFSRRLLVPYKHRRRQKTLQNFNAKIAVSIFKHYTLH